jgi:mycothiol synthase
MTSVTPVARAERLSPAEVAEVLALTHAAGDADGAFPLSEHVTLHLRHGGDLPAVHLIMREGDQLVGYAHVDTTDAVEGPSAELCVHPLHRRRGLGRALVLEAMAVAAERDPAARLRLWAHGDHPSASALALSLGFARARVLWQMRRSLFAPVPSPEIPDGVTLRPFRPGEDDAAWLHLNARAFAHLPDQGRWTAADLQARLAEGWFDPNGFLVAERSGGEATLAASGGGATLAASGDGALVGFHWTKVHGAVRHGDLADDGGSHHHDPIGEVYVLGVDPSTQGTGLGTALSLAGLRYLRDRGLQQVMLYVEESNTAAIGLYQRLGFARWSTDVCFRRAG